MNRAVLTAVLANSILHAEGGDPSDAWAEAEVLVGDTDVESMSPDQVRDIWLSAYGAVSTRV